MTATLQDRPSRKTADDGLPPPPPPTLVLAELALLGVSLATVVGYARLFADGAFFVPIAAAAVVGRTASPSCSAGSAWARCCRRWPT